MKSFLNKAMKINFLVLMGLFFIPLTSHAQEEDNNPLRKGRIFTDFDFGLHSSDTNLAHETFVSDITAEKPRALLYVDDKGFRFENWIDTMKFIKSINEI